MTKTEFIPKEGTEEELKTKIDQMEVRENNQIKKQEEIHNRIERAKKQAGDLEAQHKLHLMALEEQRQKNDLEIKERRKEIADEKKRRVAAIKRDNKRVANMKPKTIKERQINIQERLEQLGCDHIAVLAYITMGDNKSLGTEEKIRIYERRAAATTLASFTTPTLKAIEPKIEETITEIPVYVPKRGDLAGTKPEGLPSPEEDDDNGV